MKPGPFAGLNCGGVGGGGVQSRTFLGIGFWEPPQETGPVNPSGRHVLPPSMSCTYPSSPSKHSEPGVLPSWQGATLPNTVTVGWFQHDMTYGVPIGQPSCTAMSVPWSS